jgi:hypothetical protein
MAKFKVNIKVAPDIAQIGVFLLDGSGKSTILPKATQPSGEDKILEEGDYAVWVFAQPVAPAVTATITVSRDGSAPIVGTATERDGMLAGRIEFRLQAGEIT